MEDILDLYNEPYDPNMPVICFDEMPYQLLSDVLAPMPPKPGKPERFDYHYKRNGVCNLLCAFEPLTGRRILSVTRQRRRKEYAEFMKELVEIYYPNVEKIRLVQDNLNTHTGGSFYEIFDAETAQSIYKKFEFHYTPKKASWLNMVEFEFSAISKQCLDRRIGDMETMVKEVSICVRQRNEAQTKVNWQFSTSDARNKFKRFYKNDTINLL